MKKLYYIAAMLAILIIAGCTNSNDTITDSDKAKLVIFKDAGCGCCSLYADYAKQQGFDVDMRIVNSIDAIKMQYKVPSKMQSCHTGVIEGYYVEGHVPVEAIKKLLAEKPDIAGIALPGMPSGSPGMTGNKNGPFVIHAINKDGSTTEFMKI